MKKYFQMQLQALETFLCVAETGGFHAAARRLNVTQTAVSARIRSLEQATGKTLFTRGVGGTALTEFGHQFRPYAEQMLSLWSYASQDLPTQQPNRIPLRLGAQLSIWDPLLVDLAISLEERSGKLLLTLNYDHDMNMVEAVTTRVLDAALTHEAPVRRNVISHELAPERLILVDATSLNPADGAPFVDLELGTQYREHVRTVAARSPGQTIFLGNCMMALRYLLRRGGRGYFPDYVVAEHLSAGRLKRVSGATDLLLPLHLVIHPQAQSGDFEEIFRCLSDLRQGAGPIGPAPD